MAIIKICIICGKEHKVYPYNKDKKKYCSRKCVGIANAKLNSGIPLSEEHKKKISDAHKNREYVKPINHKGYKKGNIPWNKGGAEYTKETRDKMSKSKLGKKLSNETKQKMSNSHKRGEEHHNWKGGTSRIYKNGYYSREYILWRESVFKRDNFTCQGENCGAKGYVTAHHIKSFAKFPELRFDINNGITLCETCHCKVDKYRAKFKNKDKNLKLCAQ